MLKGLRNLLMRKPDEIAFVLSMTTNTLKSAEKGANVGTEVINELIVFYIYLEDFLPHSLLLFYKIKQLIFITEKRKVSAQC